VEGHHWRPNKTKRKNSKLKLENEEKSNKIQSEKLATKHMLEKQSKLN
jgi:hypothetical protein